MARIDLLSLIIVWLSRCVTILNAFLDQQIDDFYRDLSIPN